MAANNENFAPAVARDPYSCQNTGPFFTDAVQFIGKMPLKGLGDCDYIGGAAHKFGRPRGVGFMKIPHQRKSITPLLHRRQTGGWQACGNRKRRDHRRRCMAALQVREKQISHSQHLLHGVWRDNFENANYCGLARLWPPRCECAALVEPFLRSCPRKATASINGSIRLDKAGFAYLHLAPRLHDRQGRASHVLAADEIQAGRGASRFAFQQQLGNHRVGLGCAGKGAGESSRGDAPRENLNSCAGRVSKLEF